MQFKGLALVASAFVFGACGGGESAPAADTAAVAPAAEVAPAAPAAGAEAPITGTIHEVKMVGDEKGYRFEPANITAKVGDGIKFVMVSGGPHNVAFDAATLPAGTAAQLNANLGANKMADLSSNMYMNPNEGFTLSLGGLVAGTYNFNCTPHLAMNMKGVLTIQ